MNGVKTLGDGFDGRKTNEQKKMKDNGYQTAIIGKWHLGHGGNNDPTGFDYWNILTDQGHYHNPPMHEMGEEKQYEGYVTDIITDLSIEWMNNRNENQPFMLMCHHKAPHRSWEPDGKHAHMYEDIDIPEAVTFNDDFCTRSNAAEEATMRIDEDLYDIDLRVDPPKGLRPAELKRWKYQRYIKDYLRVVASIDDN